MVFFFESQDDSFVVFIGKNGDENEKMRKFLLPHDLVYLVEGYASAHVYLRMKEPITSLSDVSTPAQGLCQQLTKEKSPVAYKMKGAVILCTWASNLKKSLSGGFFFEKASLVVRVHVNKVPSITKPAWKNKIERNLDHLETEYILFQKKAKKEAMKLLNAQLKKEA